jgi:hypothetical protein
LTWKISLIVLGYFQIAMDAVVVNTVYIGAFSGFGLALDQASSASARRG